MFSFSRSCLRRAPLAATLARLPRAAESTTSAAEAAPTKTTTQAATSKTTRPAYAVFDRAAKTRQRNRAALHPHSRDADYLRDEVADRLVDRLLVRWWFPRRGLPASIQPKLTPPSPGKKQDIKRRFVNILDLGSGSGHVAKFLDKELCGKLVMYDSAGEAKVGAGVFFFSSG